MSVVPTAEQIVKYLNDARTNPSAFAAHVQKQYDSFINENHLPLKPGCNYAANESKKAWAEAIKFLKTHAPMDPFTLNEGLTLACEDHIIDMVQKGFFGHDSSNGAGFDSRIFKRCAKSHGSMGECIGSDFKVEGRNHALQTVMGLIIDDGVPDRGHRTNVFSPDFRFVGSASRVQNDKINTVIDFHSENLKTIDAKKPASEAGNKINREKNQANLGSYKPQGHNTGHQEAVFGDMQKKMNELSMKAPTGRTIVSQSSNTKSSTTNGVTKVTKVTKITYSDGSTEENTEENTSKH